MVIIDTSVWIHAFRHEGSAEKAEVDGLLARQEVLMVGPVLAEVLQGARSRREFDLLQERLTALPYLGETEQTWAGVGELAYNLRQKGTTLGLVDLLIAALALEGGHSIYTLDEHFKDIPGVKLHGAGAT